MQLFNKQTLLVGRPIPLTSARFGVYVIMDDIVEGCPIQYIFVVHKLAIAWNKWPRTWQYKILELPNV